MRGEEENPIVRSFINIYKPLLTWALPRRNLVMWMFAVLLVLAAGMFPLQAVVGQGASETAWKTTFLGVFALVTALTVMFTRGLKWQIVSLATLVLLGQWAYHFTKIGVAFMPALDEGTTLDMPITVPRASVTQAADDLKARDALLRGFPEVESVIGKAGRADTPTDPAPLDMVETFVNFRPKELWPKRVLKYADAERQASKILQVLEDKGYVKVAANADERRNLVNDATQNAIERFDETMRELALLRYEEFEQELGPALTQFAVAEAIRMMEGSGSLNWSPKIDKQAEIEQLSQQLTSKYDRWLATNPSLDDATALGEDVADALAKRGIVKICVGRARIASAFLFNGCLQRSPKRWRRPTDVLRCAAPVHRRRSARLWSQRVEEINWELHGSGAAAFNADAMEELVKAATEAGLVDGAEHQARIGGILRTQAIKSQLSQEFDKAAFAPFNALRADLDKSFADQVFFWPRADRPQRGPGR